jgi:citrate synthase
MAGEETSGELQTKNVGLRGIVVADSTISKVNGEKGILIYRGYDISALAREGTFEEVIYLLLHGKLPTSTDLDRLRHDLAECRFLPEEVIEALRTLPEKALPMDMLQAAVPLLAMHELEPEGAGPEGCRRQALGLICRLPLLISAWQRIRSGHEVVQANPDLDHATNFLYTLHGEIPPAEQARIMDVILILHADHGFNASTFTARQIASTQAHLHAAIAGALGSLSGPLHGGANQRVYRMLQQIGSVDKVEEYVTTALDNHERIMGMGHAVYQVTDPRALILGPMAADLAAKAGRPELYEIAEKVRQVTTVEMKRRKGREIYANVDFFSAIVNSMIGIPVDLFTPVFAAGRIAGWCAHYLEERFGGAMAKPVIYRPRAEYIGRYCGLEGCTWTPLRERR